MRYARFALNALIVAALGTAACSSETMAPAPEAQPTPLLSLTGGLSALLLQCTPERPVTQTQEIGPGGGEIWVGRHYLVVGKNALKKKVRIRAEVVTGRFNSVRFYPEGLQFAPGAKLYMSYKNCSGLGMLLPKKIVYIDEGLNLLELLKTIDLRAGKEVVADLRHFSRYAIAY